MGYYIKHIDSDFTMTVANAEKALAALQEWVKDKKNTYVQVAKVLNASTFAQAMDACRFPVDIVHPNTLSLPSKEDILKEVERLEEIQNNIMNNSSRTLALMSNMTKVSDKIKEIKGMLSATQDDKEYVIGIMFEGEKSDSTEEEMFNVIAPFVKAGSYIEMQGEDGARWRWVFDGETCKEKNAEISWD
jgi:hypothetical protein